MVIKTSRILLLSVACLLMAFAQLAKGHSCGCGYWSGSSCVCSGDCPACEDCKSSGDSCSCQSICVGDKICCGGECCGNVCCNDICCSPGKICCGGECCDPEDCCSGACCDTECCYGICCPSGEICCGYDCCNPDDCCHDRECCDSGEICCDDGSCAYPCVDGDPTGECDADPDDPSQTLECEGCVGFPPHPLASCSDFHKEVYYGNEVTYCSGGCPDDCVQQDAVECYVEYQCKDGTGWPFFTCSWFPDAPSGVGCVVELTSFCRSCETNTDDWYIHYAYPTECQ